MAVKRKRPPARKRAARRKQQEGAPAIKFTGETIVLSIPIDWDAETAKGNPRPGFVRGYIEDSSGNEFYVTAVVVGPLDR